MNRARWTWILGSAGLIGLGLGLALVWTRVKDMQVRVARSRLVSGLFQQCMAYAMVEDQGFPLDPRDLSWLPCEVGKLLADGDLRYYRPASRDALSPNVPVFILRCQQRPCSPLVMVGGDGHTETLLFRDGKLDMLSPDVQAWWSGGGP